MMKKLLIATALMSAFTFANANITNASINGERVRTGDTFGQTSVSWVNQQRLMTTQRILVVKKHQCVKSVMWMVIRLIRLPLRMAK